MSQQHNPNPGTSSQSPRSWQDQAKALEHLQELDLKIDQLRKSRNSLPEALRSLDQSLGKLQAQLTGKKGALGEIEKLLRQTQAALDINRDRLARSNTRLEGVQNSQEYQAVNKELEQLKKQGTGLEEQARKAQSDSEAGQKEINELTSQFDKIAEERKAQAEKLASQGSQLDGEINSLLDERRKYSSQVDSRILAQYDRVRGARGGVGIVPAVDGRCKGCNMVVPPQLYNEIRKALTVHSCPSCHRLLFVPVSSSEVESAT